MEFKKRILILCEGKKTEVNYFKAFKKDDVLKRRLSAVDVEVYKPTDHSPMGLVSEAKKKLKQGRQEKNPYDSVWAVFDKDGHDRVKDAFIKARDVGGIRIGFSNVSFEFWLFLHFERALKHFPDSNSICSYLRNNHISGYEKNLDIFQALKPRIQQAIENGRWVEGQCNADVERGVHLCDLSAYTNIGKIVELLLSLE